jgi:hypothetical protein
MTGRADDDGVIRTLLLARKSAADLPGQELHASAKGLHCHFSRFQFPGVATRHDRAKGTQPASGPDKFNRQYRQTRRDDKDGWARQQDHRDPDGENCAANDAN